MMNEVCCSSGKARIYYNIPTKGGLKYKFKGSNKWTTITSNESLISSCIKMPVPEKYYNVAGNNIYVGTFLAPFEYSAGVNYLSVTDSRGYTAGRNVFPWFTPEQGESYPPYTVAIWRADGTSPENDLAEQKYKFVVKGADSGTIYHQDQNLDECPDVQTIPCKFDPAKERFIDVEMIPYFPLPIPLPSYPINQDCIEITSVGNFVVIQKVTTRNYGPKGDNDPSVRRTEKIIKTVESPKGCPAPKVRVECCPNGICGENKRCPKGTDCESICNGFKCCYKNGKLIRSIKL